MVKPGRSDKVYLFMLRSTILGKLSRLLPLFSPGTRGHQAPQHYALLPPLLRTSAFPVTRISNYWTPLDSITSVITSHIFVCSPALFPASALIVICSFFLPVC
jgi:hypothetical protein